MVKITGSGFDGLKKHLDKKVADFVEKVKQKKIDELKRKGLYKPGKTKIVFKITVDKGGYFKNLTER